MSVISLIKWNDYCFSIKCALCNIYRFSHFYICLSIISSRQINLLSYLLRNHSALIHVKIGIKILWKISHEFDIDFSHFYLQEKISMIKLVIHHYQSVIYNSIGTIRTISLGYLLRFLGTTFSYHKYNYPIVITGFNLLISSNDFSCEGYFIS